MNDSVKVSGMILSASPVSENDKRVVIETVGLGKISAFVRGGRRQGSTLLAASNPFVTGEFTLIPGRDSYRLIEASVKEYFRELAKAQPEVYLGFYFLDLLDYYGREGIDGREMLNLTFVALKALLKKETNKKLVRYIYELRLIAQNGEYVPEADKMDEKLYRICTYITGAPLAKLFSFDLSEDMIKEVQRESESICRRAIDRPLKSVKILDLFYT